MTQFFGWCLVSLFLACAEPHSRTMFYITIGNVVLYVMTVIDRAMVVEVYGETLSGSLIQPKVRRLICCFVRQMIVNSLSSFVADRPRQCIYPVLLLALFSLFYFSSACVVMFKATGERRQVRALSWVVSS